MPKIALRTAGTAVGINGAIVGSNGISMPLVTPLFDRWASAGLDPPNGIGTDFSCGWAYACVDDNDVLHAIVRDGGGTGRGVYRYQLNTAANPITMSYLGNSALSGMGLGVSRLTLDCHDYDRATNTLQVVAYNYLNPTANTIGRWDLSVGTLTSANATWRGAPASYPTQVSGQLAYFPYNMAIDTTNNRMAVASFNGAKACVYRLSDGTFLGEKVWQSSWQSFYHPVIIGLDQNNYVITGGFTTAQHSGNAHAYDLTNPNSWVDQGKIYDRTGVNWNRTAAASWLRPLPNWGYGGFGRVHSIGPGQQADISNTADWILFVACESYNGLSTSSPKLIYHDIASGDAGWEEKFCVRPSSYGRSGFGGQGVSFINFTQINGQPWLLYSNTNSQDHLTEEPIGSYQSHGVAGMHVGIGKATYTFTVATEQKPYVLTHGVKSGQRNVEFSDHPSKHRFRMSPDNGSSWTAWRSGVGLSVLDETWNGDPAWPDLLTTETIIIEHELTSGILHNFVTMSGHHEDDTAQLPVSDLGPPLDIEPILHTEVPSAGAPSVLEYKPRPVSSLELLPRPIGTPREYD